MNDKIDINELKILPRKLSLGEIKEIEDPLDLEPSLKEIFKNLPKTIDKNLGDGFPVFSLESFREEDRGLVKRCLDEMPGKPVDSSIGFIKKIVIGYPDVDDSEVLEQYDRIYENLILELVKINNKGFSQGLDIYTSMIVEKDMIKLKENKLKNKICQLFHINDSNCFNYQIIKGEDASVDQWVQDHIIPIRKSDGSISLAGRYAIDSDTESDLRVVDAYKELFCMFRLLRSSFVGSNMLALGKYILVGMNNFRLKHNDIDDVSLYSETEMKNYLNLFFDDFTLLPIGSENNELLKAALKVSFKRNEKIHWLYETAGRNYQPIFHLDMFMTPIGKSDNGKFRIIVGIPCLLFETKEHPLFAEGGIFNYTRKSIKDIARKLSEIPDFEIIEMKLPLIWIDKVDNKGHHVERVWTFASYNNCVVQYNEQGQNFALIPRYSTTKSEQEEFPEIGDWSFLEKTESEIYEEWKNLGFNPVFLTNYLPLLEKRGAAHCITKVIGRELKDVV